MKITVINDPLIIVGFFIVYEIFLLQFPFASEFPSFDMVNILKIDERNG